MRLVVLAVFAVFVPALASAGGDVIQPGDRMLVDGDTHCTLSFVFDGVGDDAGRVFMSIASHCVYTVGQAIHTDNFARFGAIVLRGDDDLTETDIALVEVAPAFQGSVSGEVRGHPGFPTGVAHAGTTALGDWMVMSGWGTAFSAHETTREDRQGILLRHTTTVLRLEGPVSPGDSGGPWTMADGRAAAIVSKLRAGVACCDVETPDASVHFEGPTVENILATAEAAGLSLALRTA